MEPLYNEGQVWLPGAKFEPTDSFKTVAQVAIESFFAQVERPEDDDWTKTKAIAFAITEPLESEEEEGEEEDEEEGEGEEVEELKDVKPLVVGCIKMSPVNDKEKEFDGVINGAFEIEGKGTVEMRLPFTVNSKQKISLHLHRAVFEVTEVKKGHGIDKLDQEPSNN